MDSLPVGIIITDENQGLAHINQEMNLYFNEVFGETNIPENQQTRDFNSQSFDNYNNTQCNLTPNSNASPAMLIMERIKDRADNTISLKSLMKKRDDAELGEQVHNMTCDKSGKVFEIKTKYLPEIWPKGYKIAVVKDQTIYEQLVREKMLKKYQRMLISSITHEIRNPLNAIAGYSISIEETDDNAKIRHYCEQIENAIQQIDYILTGACDILCSESYETIVQTQDFNLKNAIDSVIKIVSPSIEHKELIIKTIIDPNVPEIICSDQKKYKIVLFNLLINAIKYTHEGSIHIRIAFDDSTNTLRTTVEDTGIGFDSKRLPTMFELYENIENVNQFNPQGMGLGLSLCKKLTKELGGDISALSEINLGSTFSFTVCNGVVNLDSIIYEGTELNYPLEEIKGEVAVNKTRTFNPKTMCRIGSIAKSCIRDISPTVRCNCPEVLIVDDDPTNRAVLKVYLNSVNMASIEAENGKIAVNLVEKRLQNKCCQRFRLIFMDINMPEMDGTEATSKIKKICESHPEATANIIGVTAANLQTRNDIKELLSVGFNDICIFLFAETQLIIIFKIGQKPIIKAQFIENMKRFIPKVQ